MGTEIYFTSNPADVEKLPGLYINEKNPPGFIQGVDVSQTIIASKAVRGPDTWTEITSGQRFKEIFGERDYVAGGTLIGQGWAALLNKQFGKVMFKRVRAAAAVKATVNLQNVTPATVAVATASSVGVWANTGNGLTLAIENATDANVNHWNLRVSYRGEEVLYENLDTSAGNNNLAEKIGEDPARFIDLSKSIDGRPLNNASLAMASGTDGAIADSDYISAINEMPAVDGGGICLVPEAAVTSHSALNGAAVTAFANLADRVWVAWSGVHGETPAAAVTAVAAQITTRTDRVFWAYNSARTMDPSTALLIPQGPHLTLASILSQTDVGVHPGDDDNKRYAAGVKSLYSETLTRGDLITLRQAGISTLEKVKGGFKFRDAVTTSLVTGRTEITRRRIVDFLQLSASERLVNFVKKKGTRARRAQMVAEIIDFSKRYMEDEAGDAALIEKFEVLNDSVNTSQSRARSKEKLLWRVDLVDHMLYILLETEMGTGVTIATN